MRYDLKEPCHDCPWRKTTFLRQEEIDDMMGGIVEMDNTHTCHCTKNDDSTPHDAEQHCVGSLLFAEENNIRSNPVEIAIKDGSLVLDELRDIDCLRGNDGT